MERVPGRTCEHNSSHLDDNVDVRCPCSLVDVELRVVVRVRTLV